MKASVCLPVVSNRDAHVFVPPHHLVPHNCSTNFAPPKKEAKTIFNNTHTGENFAIIHVYVCVCSQLHWGEASLFTYLEESLLFNLSSVKLTYCPPLTAHVWPIQTLPRVVVCAYRYLTDTHTHTYTTRCSMCQSTSAATSFIKAGNKSALWCERKVLMDPEPLAIVLWRYKELVLGGVCFLVEWGPICKSSVCTHTCTYCMYFLVLLSL